MVVSTMRLLLSVTVAAAAAVLVAGGRSESPSFLRGGEGRKLQADITYDAPAGQLYVKKYSKYGTEDCKAGRFPKEYTFTAPAGYEQGDYKMTLHIHESDWSSSSMHTYHLYWLYNNLGDETDSWQSYKATLDYSTLQEVIFQGSSPVIKWRAFCRPAYSHFNEPSLGRGRLTFQLMAAPPEQNLWTRGWCAGVSTTRMCFPVPRYASHPSRFPPPLGTRRPLVIIRTVA
eukprot:GHVU01198354.1.p1 GENE.GHVU01198354.1~~GHVU01198354.1.p1  ORF type:complete len:230 (-),score=9.96 GHVU01198354.1:146-835(-)